MVATDFEYDGEYLKNKGCVICNSDSSSGFESIDNISVRTFDSLSQYNGKKFTLTTSYYEDRIEITFQICKDVCLYKKATAFTSYEIKELKRWLGRPSYHKFKLIQPEWSNYYMNGSFNITELQLMGKTYILELKFVSDAPMAKHEPITNGCTIAEPSKEHFSFIDISDEIGQIYPNVIIECLSDGDLDIYNEKQDRHTVFKNCKEGEIITITNDLIIATSLPSHKIQNDFNYKFLSISNTYKSRINRFTFSIPVKIKMKYSPFAKVVL